MPETGNKADYYVGVDFGSTKIYAGVFNPELNLVGTARISTKSTRGTPSVIERIGRAIKDAVDECDLTMERVRGVGVGAPGAVDPEAGRVIFAPNLGWENIPLKRDLEKDLDVPVFVENDGNVAIIGIHEVELGSKVRNALGIFIGTGIGAGFVLNGELYTGHNHAAGEIGHMVLQVDGPKCRCGNLGCFEALASRTAIFRKIQSAVKDGQKTVLTEMLGKNLEDLRSGHLSKAIRQGDKFVEKVVKEAAQYTGVAIANLINVMNPEVVVLGGGIIEALEDV